MLSNAVLNFKDSIFIVYSEISDLDFISQETKINKKMEKSKGVLFILDSFSLITNVVLFFNSNFQF